MFIEELSDSSEDTESDNLIKRYKRRPKKLEELCLADFAAWYIRPVSNAVLKSCRTKFII